MSALRVPLLCAFAGGCLSAAVVLAVWRADNVAAIPAQQQLARSNELLAAAIAARNAEQREAANHAEPAPAPVARTEPERESDAKAEPAALKDAEPAPAGSAVADVLTDLEAAYRKRLVALASAQSSAPASAASEPGTSAPAEPPPELPIAAAAPSAPVAPPAPIAAPVAVVAAPAIAPAAVAPVPAAPEAPAAVVAQNDVRPPDVHYGDVNQNTYITNVRQGDTYVVQQQIAMLQYVQLLGLSSAVRLNQAGRTRAGRSIGARSAAQAAPQYKQFPSTLTNPDNPWGFSFSPPNLVH